MDFVRDHLREEWLDSAGGRIHLDIYERWSERPVAVLSHGMAGYGRLLANVAWVLHRRGFNVVLPDLKGYGHNPGRRGGWRWGELVQNLLDACRWAEANVNPAVCLGGASMGGPLAYHAACRGEPVKALACYCLYDHTWPDLQRAISRFGPLTPVAGPAFRLLARLMPRLPLPATMIASYYTLSNDPAFNRTVRSDPMAGNVITLGAAVELIGTPLPIPFEAFDLVPILVLNPEEDEITPSRFTAGPMSGSAPRPRPMSPSPARATGS
jgi:alpha-beta hydrolase superfamily lysophospholipase